MSEFTEFPEAPPSLHMLLALMRADFCLHAKQTDETMSPFPAQYDMGPGDFAALAMTESAVDKDFVVMRLVNPEDYAEQFPDWAERLQKSYVLAKWISLYDHDSENLGWFARVKLVQLTSQQYEESVTRLKDKDFDPNQPSWLFEQYEAYNVALAEHADNDIGKRIRCANCGSRNTNIHMIRMEKWAAPAMMLEQEGEDTKLWIPHTHPDREGHAHIHCDNCDYRVNVDAGRVQMPAKGGHSH